MYSATSLLHSFVSPHVDYCNTFLAGAPKAVTNKLQSVLNAAARMVSGTDKYDRGLSRLPPLRASVARLGVTTYG